MKETFTYSQKAGTIRKKTLSGGQKFFLYTAWIFLSVFTVLGIMLQQYGVIPESAILLCLIIFVPIFLCLFLIVWAAMHPRGPERDFELPGIETDLSDSSLITGRIKTKDHEVLEVEVRVPNVYGAKSDLLETNPAGFSTGELAHAEMISFANEELGKKYKDFAWEGEPEVRS